MSQIFSRIPPLFIFSFNDHSLLKPSFLFHRRFLVSSIAILFSKSDLPTHYHKFLRDWMIYCILVSNRSNRSLVHGRWPGVLGASAFQCMRAGFLCPKCDNFACLQPGKIKMSFIGKDDFFAKIGIFCKSIAEPLSEAKKQTYSFGGRIKLIICQIRHELSVTIHGISNS